MKGDAKTGKVTVIFLLIIIIIVIIIIIFISIIIFITIIIILVIGGKRSFIFVEKMLSVLQIYTHCPHKIVLVFLYSKFFH